MEPPLTMTDAAFDRVRRCTVEVLEVSPDDVVPSARFTDDLGADSLDVVELVEALEAEFGVRIQDDELADIATIGDALAVLLSKLG